MNTYIHIKNAIINFINNDEYYKNKFNHHNQKYKLEELLDAVIIILRKNIPYRDISKYVKINWNTIYQFHIKMIKLEIYKNVFNHFVLKYTNELNSHIKSLFVDSTLILNKLGTDSATYNPQLKKHKTTKISIIMDDFRTPLSINITNSNVHDCTIIKSQLTELNNFNKNIINENTNLIADGAYDSNELQEIFTNCGGNKLITPTNIRNTKNKAKIKRRFNTLYEKLLLNKRINVEHLINKYKNFKRLYIRYDKYLKNYEGYVYLASLILLLKNYYC